MEQGNLVRVNLQRIINYFSAYLSEEKNSDILELLESSKEFEEHNEWDLAFEDIIYICIDLSLDIENRRGYKLNGERTNIRPRTGEVDPDRIISEDGTRSIRYGNHEMNSSPTKHHYHEETWRLNSETGAMDVDNVVVRVPYPKPKK